MMSIFQEFNEKQIDKLSDDASKVNIITFVKQYNCNKLVNLEQYMAPFQVQSMLNLCPVEQDSDDGWKSHISFLALVLVR